MIFSIYVHCSQCGRKLDLSRLEKDIDYTIEIHDGEECYFCEPCNSEYYTNKA